MRAHARALAAATVLATMRAISPAFADEPPPPDPSGLPPLPVAPKPAARPPTVRFDDEKQEPHAAARLYAPADARSAPGAAGIALAHLPIDVIVTRLASRGSMVLVQYDDPEDGYTRMGWVPATALTIPPTPEPDDGMTKVHLDAQTGVTLELRVDRRWQEVCEAPCDIRLPLEGEYRTHGKGFRASRVLRLKPVGGRAVITVDGASSGVGDSGGAGIALVVLGGAGLAVGAAIVMVGFASAFMRSSESTTMVVGGAVMGGGAVIGLIGAVILASRPGTTVTQPTATAAARVPTWTTGLERTPAAGASFALQLLAGTF